MLASEFSFAYGTNPHQGQARAYARASRLPFSVLHGQVSYNNLADALQAWSIASDLGELTDLGAVASVKYGRPVGAALVQDAAAGPTLSPRAAAARRARATNPQAAVNDWLALSEAVDGPTAAALVAHPSDGIIAPAFDDDARRLVQAQGPHLRVVQIDPSALRSDASAPLIELRSMFGMLFEQESNDVRIGRDWPLTVGSHRADLSPQVRRDLLFGMIITKYTPARAVCVVHDAGTCAVAAGAQSEAESVEVGLDRADDWSLRQQRAQPTGLVLCTSVSLRHSDSIVRAHRSGVHAILQPDMPPDAVVQECDERGMLLIVSGLRLIYR